MKRIPKLVAISLATTMLALSGTSSSDPAFARGHRHRHSANVQTGVGAGETAPLGTNQPRGLFAGAGGIYSPNYVSPAAPVYHLGGQLLGGGEYGKAYEDYYDHYYYYKYAYCPLGSTYLIATRS